MQLREIPTPPPEVVPVPSYPPAELHLFVPGVAAPQGSKRYVGNGVSIESSKHVKPWRADIRAALLTAIDESDIAVPITGPTAVQIKFLMPRPKSHYRTGRNAHLLRDAAPNLPTGKPDIDKLARAVLDAISSAGVWHDDSQVVDLHPVKVYTPRGDRPGAWITIMRLGL